MDNRQKGKYGENRAADYLRKRGWRILARNYGVRGGEIDLIGFRRGELVFFEVKTRSSDAWGSPGDAIGREKLDRIRKAAKDFLYRSLADGRISVPYPMGVRIRRRVRSMRVDGIEIYLSREGGFRELRVLKSLAAL